ncbi:exodeoxyribonuclease V subunit gamma [Nocardia cyriacigeorgica]|uniref:RecBCD enzyme subunit RecC n=1 Tax=Nocardia cyriacigeorgica TaxID=135487 RepID=A0A6P1D3U9_9NOCA|nr:exodeoxyribonuclease V subunit gamma [Nocardia cyriacigeorgica]NEW39928.1 exodeoxyribonuclease V subunit gamma [Nocardia cyriacigeorgica]NEW45256.1 exodeoxyribonuclease V subunit gamma [Nocardia cyriacigeorgica]NEW51411.1 exodeoxyribonuclease V subunit gamma [Nocardia cyriacigeorgica]NEW55353.1 exodeoxyribonuclease V subunit gamma [Nocardia cyriacigeorgica]
MPLHIHRGERADVLADALAALLSDPLPDPFATEVVAVPAKGVERWLTQRLSGVLGVSAPSGGDGVAANIAFPSPGALVAEALAAAGGIAPANDPWAHDRVVWTLMRVIDTSLAQPWCAVLARHLGVRDGESSHRAGRRYATAAHLATLFDSYGGQRPQLIADWVAGADADGAGQPVPDDLRWQVALWRQLRAEIGTPSPAERLGPACEQLRTEPGSVQLPARVSLFGPTRLPADQLAVVSALAEHRDIHLWLTHPSPAMWAALERLPSSLTRAEDRTAAAVAHPLLAGLGRDVRELQQRLPVAATDRHHGSAEEATGDRLGAAGNADTPDHRDVAVGADSAGRADAVRRPHRSGRPTLLQALQGGIRDDQWPAVTGEADSSVHIHACHGPSRQVEVLRDCLLAMFADDPTLEPRDVLIMCPEVEAYAPLVRAAFGQRVPGAIEAVGDSGGPGHPAHRLRVRLADRGRAVTNPLLGVISVLLDLADGRVTVTQVLDLAASETVRRRCGFDDDDIERLREWAAETGARWGIGQRQRQAFGLADFAQNTLNTAVDRILLGVTAGETSEDWLDLALPLDDVDSNDVDLAGRFAEFIDRLAVALRDLRGPRPASDWAAVLSRALELLTDVPESQAWIRTEARRELAAATAFADGVPLRLADVAVLLAGRLAARPTRANFRTGELTVCTMVPMRSVPHRVVVLLGLDDDVFPRAGAVDGDDVLARNPLLGERDHRAEDRQLLLDAIMAAGERLVLLHTGSDPISGSHRPPAIPVAELLDVLRAHVGSAGMGEVVTRHPLQSFDRRNFRAERPFSFDTVALAGARAAGSPPQPRPLFLPAPLPAADPVDVGLAELMSFAEHPVRAFLWQRLGVRVPDQEDDIADRLPIELDGLAKWDLGERMLAARLNGAEAAGLRAAEWRRGTLPPFGLGGAVLQEVEHTVDTLVRIALPEYEIAARAVDIVVDLGGGRRLTGTVPEVRGDALVRTTYSRLAPKHRITAWVPLLALAATQDRPWRAVTIGRGQFRRPAWRSELTAPSAPEALAILRELVALRDTGLAEPLPIATAATAAYAERRFRGGTMEEGVAAAEREFNGGANGPDKYGEHTDRHLRYIWGPAPRIDDLIAAPAPPGEPGESTRFGALSRRLWVPLLRAEEQAKP